MEHQKKINELQVKLSRWKSHREIHAQPSDNMLYELLKELLDLLHGEEEMSIPDEPQQISNEQAIESDPPGGNNPEAPDVP